MNRHTGIDDLVRGVPRRAFLRLACAAGLALAAAGPLAAQTPAAQTPTAQTPAAQAPGGALPIFDAHIHYSHDAWDVVPTAAVIALMRQAGLRRALVSSSDDEGTQRLLAAAPDLVIPSLRPYRRRGELQTWMHDPDVARHVEDRLARHRYAAIGEFHLYGADADLPVPRRLVQLARDNRLVLHAHSDADAVERIFRQDPGARVLWAHAGFDRPENVRALLQRHRTLWADLAFRSEHGAGGRVDPAWRELFAAFPDRFMVGTDTFTPEQHYIHGARRLEPRLAADLPARWPDASRGATPRRCCCRHEEANRARGDALTADPCAQLPAGSESGSIPRRGDRLAHRACAGDGGQSFARSSPPCVRWAGPRAPRCARWRSTRRCRSTGTA
jgi:hypothetical protein